MNKRKQGIGSLSDSKPNIKKATLRRLEEAFELGCPDEEACGYAGISPSILYNYQLKNPKYKEYKELLKRTPDRIARSTVVKRLKDDPKLAFKWLQNKLSNEFSTATKTDNTTTYKIEIAQDTLNRLNQRKNTITQPLDDIKEDVSTSHNHGVNAEEEKPEIVDVKPTTPELPKLEAPKEEPKQTIKIDITPQKEEEVPKKKKRKLTKGRRHRIPPKLSI